MRLLTHDQVSDLPSKPFEPRMPYTPACLLSRPTEPEYQKPGIFNKRKVEESNAALKADYETRLEAYEAEKRACDEEKARAEAEYETQMKAYNQQLEQRNRMIRKAAEGNLQGELKKMEGSGVHREELGCDRLSCGGCCSLRRNQRRDCCSAELRNYILSAQLHPIDAAS